jgi:hypothetical protein
VEFFLPVTRYLGWVPRVGGDLRFAPALLNVAQSVVEAGNIAYDGLEPLVPLTKGLNGEGQLLSQTLNILTDARPALQAAQDQLEIATKQRSEIDDRALSARTAELILRLDRYLPLMQTAVDGGQLLPDLLGASGRQAFLVLAENNDELRATGGFISAVGHLVLDKGEIVDITFEDSYLVDDYSRSYPDSPPPILRYMGIDQWVFRDANWTPDFPTSAQKAIELYRISRELDVDGVLAVDQHALQAIVAAMAPLEVEGWPEPVTAENVIPLIRLAWSPVEAGDRSTFDSRWWQQRKSFIGDMVGAMQAKVEAEPDRVNWLELARALLQVLDERHFQIWLADRADPAVDLLAEQGWDGATREAVGDYLMVIDTNMGYNKANAMVEQSLDYRVLVNVNGAAQATLLVRHNNSSTGERACEPQPHYGADYDDLIDRCYWNYLRVYAPMGSQLLAATAHQVPGNLLVTGQGHSGTPEVLLEELGKTVFGSFFVLQRGRDIETRFVYQLPEQTLEQMAMGWRYRLFAQKQAGTTAVPLHVELVLPTGSSVQSVEPREGTHDGQMVRQLGLNTVVFDVTLEKDRVFEVLFQFDEH